MKGMIADAVTAADDFLDHIRMLQRVHAGDKKSCLDRVLVEHIQYLTRYRIGRAIVKGKRNKMSAGISPADDRQIKTALRKKGSGDTKENIRKGDGYRKQRMNKKDKSGNGQKNYSRQLSGTEKRQLLFHW